MIKPNEDNEILLKISILCGYNQHNECLHLNFNVWKFMGHIVIVHFILKSGNLV